MKTLIKAVLVALVLFSADHALADATIQVNPAMIDAVQSAVQDHSADVRDCYAANLVTDQPVGKFTVKIVVSKYGRVRGVYVHGMGFSQDALVEKCVLTRAQSWRFPRTGYQVTVNRPFLLVLARR